MKNHKPSINSPNQPKREIIGGVFNKILFSIIFLFGLFAILITSHEVYHLHNGTPTGICVGDCMIENKVAFAVLFVNKNLSLTDSERLREENSAWAFAFISTTLIFFLFCITKYPGEKK